MIESSVIKLILIVALNICFVWVWVKKENLRSVMPFEIIRKLEEKVCLKKVKKLISFIGNISMFWVLNISYLVLIKFFEKELNLILGFPEGITKDAISQTNVLKSNYIYANSLDEITKFIFDTGNMPTLFVGVTALMIPIYLYIIGFKSKSKRQLLLMLTKKGDMFYISFYIYVMLFFKVEKIFLIGAIGYLIFLLMEAVKWIMKIENSLYSFEGLDKILESQEEEEIIELYNATLNELYQGVKDSNVSLTHENKELLVKMLRNNELEVKVDSRKLLKSLYDIYDVAIKNQDDDIFRKISYIHIHIAQYYLRIQADEIFYWALYGMGQVYDYHYKNGTDKFALDVVSGFQYDSFGLYEKYREDFQEGKLWYAQKYRAIIEGIKRTVENDDLYFFKEFIYLIGQEFEYKENLKRDYKLLEKSVYFGVLLYLKEEKRKSKGDKNLVEKINKFVEFIEKRLLKETDLIDLIELYEFIDDEKINEILCWDEYSRPKMNPVKNKAYVRGVLEKESKRFLELLGKIGNFQQYKNALSKDEHLKQYFRGECDEDREKSINRINKFKENASGLLNDLKEYRDKIDITKENYKEIEGLLIEFKKGIEQKEKEKIRGAEISLDKINIFKEELERILSESKIIKWLKNLEKYKKSIEKEKGKIRYFAQYEQKEDFVELRDKGGIKAIAEYYGKGQNKGIEQIMIDKLNLIAEDSGCIENALKNIKGEPWIILTGIGIRSFFYEKSGGDRENIVLHFDLDKGYLEKYGEILQGIYKYKGTEIPIYNFKSDKKGVYILGSNDIKEFIHYNPNFEIKDSKGVEKKIDIIVEYASLKITDTTKILEKREEEVLKYEWVQELDSDEEKIKHFKELVLIEFNQKGELKLKEDAVVYKVEFNG